MKFDESRRFFYFDRVCDADLPVMKSAGSALHKSSINSQLM